MNNDKESTNDTQAAELICGLTQAKIDELKNKYGQLTAISLPDEDKHFIFKKPSMAIMSAVAKAAQKDPIQASLVFFKNCLVHGDETAADDIDVFANISPYLEEIIETKRVEVKNL